MKRQIIVEVNEALDDEILIADVFLKKQDSKDEVIVEAVINAPVFYYEDEEREEKYSKAFDNLLGHPMEMLKKL